MSLEEYKLLTDDDAEKVLYREEDGKITGSISREEGVKKHLFLEVAQLWIINPKTKKVLMQRRSKDEKMDANMIDASCGGHRRPTEIPEQTMLRESFEELGVIPPVLFPKLQKLKKITIDMEKAGRQGKYIATEFLAFLEYPLEYYKPNKEVAELFEEDWEVIKQKIRLQDKEMRIPYTKEIEEILNLIDSEIEQYMKQEEKKDSEHEI